MKSNFYVYEHWRTDRDECFYVGKGTGGRAYNMSKRNKYHKAIVAKLLREGFAVEIRIVASGLSSQDSFSLEIERIAFWRSVNVDLTNMTDGGDGANNPSEETRKKLAEYRKGKLLNAEIRKKMSESRRKRGGIPHTEEARRKITEAKKNPSQETRRKMSEAKKGKPRSAETCKKIAEFRKSFTYSEESRRKMSESSKKQWVKRKSMNIMDRCGNLTVNSSE